MPIPRQIGILSGPGALEKKLNHMGRFMTRYISGFIARHKNNITRAWLGFCLLWLGFIITYLILTDFQAFQLFFHRLEALFAAKNVTFLLIMAILVGAVIFLWVQIDQGNRLTALSFIIGVFTGVVMFAILPLGVSLFFVDISFFVAVIITVVAIVFPASQLSNDIEKAPISFKCGGPIEAIELKTMKQNPELSRNLKPLEEQPQKDKRYQSYQKE